MSSLPLFFGLLRLPADFSAIVLAWIAAYTVRPVTDLIPSLHIAFPVSALPPFFDFFRFATISALILVLFFTFSHLYALRNRIGVATLLWRILLAVGAWGAAIVSFFAIVRHELFFSRVVLAQAMLFSVIFVFIFREVLRAIEHLFFRFGIGKTRILLIGSGSLTREIADRIERSSSLELAGVVSFRTGELSDLFTVGTIASLRAAIFEHAPAEVWLCEPYERDREILDLCQRSAVLFRWIPDTQDALLSRIETIDFWGYPVLSIEPTPISAWGRIAKRAVDFIGSGAALVALSPFFLIVAAVVAIDSSGPIFYGSERVGRGGERFKMWKFRSMIVNADELKEALKSQNHRSDTPLFKIKNDPRITSVGRFLRRWSIDELPQLWNVLRGEMSLIGPRAHLPSEVERYEPHQLRVLTVKPGITGISQAAGRSDLPFAEEIRLDLFYIAHWSFFLDLTIIWRTVRIILSGRGAD